MILELHSDEPLKWVSKWKEERIDLSSQTNRVVGVWKVEEQGYPWMVCMNLSGNGQVGDHPWPTWPQRGSPDSSQPPTA